MSLLATYASAQSKIHRNTEDEHHTRAHDPSNDLTDEEAAITLLVLQVETGIKDDSALTDEQREVVRYALTSETEED
jgi:hypothetical protein